MEQLKQEAQQIRDETVANQNTATRVGGWMVRLVDRLQEVFQKKLGENHKVEVETTDYGKPPVSSLVFDGEQFDLRLQIPRGKDGEPAIINNNGDWEMGESVVVGNAGFGIDVSPENPLMNSSGVVTGTANLTVSCYYKNLLGQKKVLESDTEKQLRATYMATLDSGLTVNDQELRDIAASMLVPAQKTIQGKRSSQLFLELLSKTDSSRYASAEVKYNRQGETGEPGQPGTPGQPGGVFKPVWTGGSLGFELARGDSLPSIIQNEPVVPTIGENGNWFIGQEDLGIKADVQPAYEAAQSAQTAAQNAATLAGKAKILVTNTDGVLSYQTGTCPDFNDQGREYVIIDLSVPGDEYLTFCATLLMETTDKIAYILFRNTDTTRTVVLTFSKVGSGDTYAPASSITLGPGKCREISYFRSSVNDSTYISFGPSLSKMVLS